MRPTNGPAMSGAMTAMKLLCLLQRPFLKTNLGTGFIVIAKAI